MVAVPLPLATLAAAVTSGNPVTLGYPAGYVQADFTGAMALDRAQAAVNDNDIYDQADGEIGVSYGASTIVLTNLSGVTWPAGARVRLHAARQASGESGGVSLTPAALVSTMAEAAGDVVLGPVLGAEVARAAEAMGAGDRSAHLAAMGGGSIAEDEIWQTGDGEASVQGLEVEETVAALPSDEATGTSEVLESTIASRHFWRRQQSVSVADSSPLNFHFQGNSNTPGSANHTLNVLVSDVNAAVTWQVQGIAAGLAGAEGKITFHNTGSSARNCFPQNHATSGASVRYADGVVQGDLVLPTGSGSRLTVYFEIITDGATGVIEITGQRKRTA